MAISIIVEDGSNVLDSNAYVNVADVTQYALNRGVVLPSDPDEVAAMIIQATDYLEAQSCKFQGRPTYSDQSLAWPRECVELNCQPFPNNAIPKQLKSAQSQLVMAVNAGFVLQGNATAADYVIEETVGPLTTKYADPTKIGLDATFAAAESLLDPLYGCCEALPGGLRTVRV